ncbi:hypothetical protein KVR01_001697 [Diaporthe batatas]|uniref:uncharacterized protein n=1 Tax=Diaporthe batatas TaxID=748121 RepID=UPI001D03B630|nr:uncharacterized protein KVR01_001697 [Diaporthe batatas]KAG8168948.1 hypothetical protein KVR01_001697 [Diaporthe batatas]
MQFSLAATLSLLTSTEAAQLWSKPSVKHVKTKAAVATSYTWSVTGWSAGCARAGCYYDFNISAPAFSNSVPAFKAYCSGFGEGTPYDKCELLDNNETIRQVAARLESVNTGGTGAHLAVSYEFVDPTSENAYWNYTAYAVSEYSSLLLNFTVQPTEIWGVA